MKLIIIVTLMFTWGCTAFFLNHFNPSPGLLAIIVALNVFGTIKFLKGMSQIEHEREIEHEHKAERAERERLTPDEIAKNISR